MQKERKRKHVRVREPSDREAGLLPSLPAQGGWDQTLSVKGRKGRCQALVPLSCFVISWLSMSPISLKSQLGWKAEAAPGGGCGPASLFKRGLNVASRCLPHQKMAALRSGVGNPGLSIPFPQVHGLEGKGWV